MSTPSSLRSLASLDSAVRQAVAEATVTDIHTHLFPPSHGNLLLWGVDELLTYHYLVSELMLVAPRELTPAKFYALPKARQAELVWEHLFIRRSPVSEATRGVVRTLERLGLDPGKRKLASLRSFFAAQKIETYLPRVLALAGVDYAVMTNDPFNADEVQHFQQRRPIPEVLKTALRIDTLILNLPAAAKQMAAQGYAAAGSGPRALAKARQFLQDWAARIRPLYMAASLPPTFAYPEGPSARILDEVVLPVAGELGLPLAMMIGVKRQVNPALLLAGDGAGLCDVSAVEHLAQRNPGVKFLVTLLARANQHELCVTARKFPNLHVFGCWWFCNQASIVREMTTMRVEMLGSAFTAQHSDSRVLDQLLYKWSEARRILADVLAEKYRDLFQAGWRPQKGELARDVRRWVGGSFEEFLAR